MEEQQLRFSGLPWFPKPETKISITIGGAGGIGSWAAFFLSRIGYDINIFDFDTIEQHNLGGQLYSKNSIGQLKVEGLLNTLRNFSNEDSLNTYSVPIDDNFRCITPYVISAFDNMRARKNLFESALNLDYLNQSEEMQQNIEANGVLDTSIYSVSDYPLFIDGRLEAEQLQIFCVRLNNQEDIEKYRETLFNDNEAEDAPCSFKQTSHNAALIGSLITGVFTNHITNVVEGEDIRTVPFKTELYVPFMHLNLE